MKDIVLNKHAFNFEKYDYPEARGDLLQFMYWPDVDDFAFPL